MNTRQTLNRKRSDYYKISDNPNLNHSCLFQDAKIADVIPAKGETFKLKKNEM
ncbi:hypothetical protein [Flavobacterium sp. LB2R40]|uniref:hypothetical protein n=1 Tax=Flavobacterium sp. LB2R40 TaxID=3401722 RepID=UPI003AB0A01C